MPWPDNVDRSQLRIDYYRAGGPGGQKVNKTSSACRITHIPTGLHAQSQDSRMQHENKRTAFRRLAEQLVPLMKVEVIKERFRSTERIRTYNKNRGKVVDDRLNKTYAYDRILDGELEQLHRDLLSADTEKVE